MPPSLGSSGNTPNTPPITSGTQVPSRHKVSTTLDLYVGQFEKRKVNDSGQRLAAVYSEVLPTRATSVVLS